MNTTLPAAAMVARVISASLVLATMFSASSWAQEAEELAKKLSNPIASLISVPLQFNYDRGYGSADGYKSFVNVQPVIPISLGQDWNLISRTILPLVDQKDIAGRSGRQSGLGDVTQSLFFSPKAPTSGGIIWGVGPVFLLPTATNRLLGTEKFGAGPTGVVLTQRGPWTFGALGNHIWSVAGDGDRANVSLTYIQPFISYTTKTAMTFNLNTETVYDWKADQWSVPINFNVSQLVKIGDQPISLGAGVRYWAEAPAGGPEGWGVRATVTFLFPK